MRLHASRTIVALAAAAVVTGVAILAVASPGQHNGLTTAYASAEAAANVSVLDRPPTGTDTLPSRLQLSLDHVPAVPNEAASRKASQRGGIGSYVVPTSDGGICLALDDVADGYGTTSCGTAADVNAGRVFSVSSGPNGRLLVAGVVPDGVSSVGVSYVDGTSADVTVEGNTFQILGTAQPSRIAWSSETGSGGYTFPRLPAAPATG